MKTVLFGVLFAFAVAGVPAVRYAVAYLKAALPWSWFGDWRTRVWAFVVGVGYAALLGWLGVLDLPEIVVYALWVRVVILGVMLGVLAGGMGDAKKT